MTTIISSPKIIVSYKPINRQNIENVQLVDQKDVDYQLFIENISNKPKQKSVKYLQLYLQYKEELEEYFTSYKLFLNKVSYIQLDYIPTCSNCYHCKKNNPQYGTGYICWQGWQSGKPNKVELHSICSNHQPKFNELITILLLNEHFELIEKRVTTHSFANNIKTNWERENVSIEEKAIRAAYEWSNIKNKINNKILPNFNRPVLTNILIECFNQNINKVRIGADALKYETSIGEIITRSKIPILPNIFKIKYIGTSLPQFKRMDFHIKINSIHYILEVFTFRNREEKAQQAKDYVHLLSLCDGTLDIRPLLVEKFYPFLEPKEGDKINNVPIVTEKGLINFLHSNGGLI